ncbi:hypothetical protein P9112_003971 [Eukaryota sp. TZLM1-RC]
MTASHVSSQIQIELSKLRKDREAIISKTCALRSHSYQLVDGKRNYRRFSKYLSKTQQNIQELSEQLESPEDATTNTNKQYQPKETSTVPHIPVLTLTESHPKATIPQKPRTFSSIETPRCKSTAARRHFHQKQCTRSVNPRSRPPSNRSSIFTSTSIASLSSIPSRPCCVSSSWGDHGVRFCMSPSQEPLPLWKALFEAGTMRHLPVFFSFECTRDCITLTKRTSPLTIPSFNTLSSLCSLPSLCFPFWHSYELTKENGVVEEVQDEVYRDAVFSSEALQVIIHEFWSLSQENSLVSKDEYVVLNLRIAKSLFPLEEFDNFEAGIRKLIENDWEIDCSMSQGSNCLCPGSFYCSILSLAHQWCGWMSIEIFDEFLKDLLSSISDVSKFGKRKAKLLTSIYNNGFLKANLSCCLGFYSPNCFENLAKLDKSNSNFDHLALDFSKLPPSSSFGKNSFSRSNNQRRLSTTRNLTDTRMISSRSSHHGLTRVIVSRASHDNRGFGKLSNEGLLRGSVMERCLTPRFVNKHHN